MPFEGWLLRDAVSGSYWVVKGYEHPSDRLIVVPYRASAGGPAVPEYLPCIGRTALTVRRDLVEAIDPVRALRSASLPGEVHELLDRLGSQWAGLTGSYAINAQGPTSDVDLLVYSERASDLYGALRDLRADGLIGECNQEIRYLKEKDSFARSEFLLLHPLKLLDSCYKGVPYTLRILRAAEERPCSSRFTSLGFVTLRGSLKGLEPYMTPARYVLSSSGVGEVYLVSWRTRYQELPDGVYLVRGLLQRDENMGSLYLVPDLGGYVRPVTVRSR
ncbi:MAG: nucleotidyltransferase domain-containing protein [Acidianus sp.]|nr:MAG: Nucleotidyltransferase domain [uncultured Acidilobus sp. OSP8]MDT7866998.1 nucleotidyltransferase domain-containing protein [Acidianus sp.]